MVSWECLSLFFHFMCLAIFSFIFLLFLILLKAQKHHKSSKPSKIFPLFFLIFYDSNMPYSSISFIYSFLSSILYYLSFPMLFLLRFNPFSLLLLLFFIIVWLLYPMGHHLWFIRHFPLNSDISPWFWVISFSWLIIFPLHTPFISHSIWQTIQASHKFDFIKTLHSLHSIAPHLHMVMSMDSHRITTPVTGLVRHFQQMLCFISHYGTLIFVYKPLYFPLYNNEIKLVSSSQVPSKSFSKSKAGKRISHKD